MGDSTHTLTASGTGETTKQVFVPADVQREKGICIDDQVEVTIHNVTELIDKASFTNKQTGGDYITIPADVVRQLGIEGGETYEFSFEPVTDELPGGIPDEEVEEALDGVESEPDEEEAGLGELFSTDDEDETEDEQEEEGLGELFG